MELRAAVDAVVLETAEGTDRPEAEVRRYHAVMWARYGELAEGHKFLERVTRGEARRYLEVVYRLQALECFAVGQGIRLVRLREIRCIDQLHTRCHFQAAGTADHDQARHPGLACRGCQLSGHFADAADVIARTWPVGAGQHVVAGDGRGQCVGIIQRGDHRMGTGQLRRQVLRAAHDQGQCVAGGQRVARDLAADVAGGTDEGDFHGELHKQGEGKTTGPL
jgi:hypothetical protein